MAFQLPPQLVTTWDKLKVWLSTEEKAVSTVFSTEEQAVIAAFRPILQAAEPVTLSALIDFISVFLVTSQGAKDLATWEAAVLNELETTGGQLFTIAKGLGSNLLQALIGVLLAGLPTKAP